MHKYYRGFTLAELMIVITLIALLSIGVSRINFNTFTDKEKGLVFRQKIISRIDTVKNYAKNGYSLGTNLQTPQRWRVVINNTGINSEYTFDNVSWNLYSPLSYSFVGVESIGSIVCKNLVSGISDEVVSSATIEFSSTGNLIRGCSGPDFTTLEVGSNYKQIPVKLQISTLNGVIEALK